jgi:hypothetical protein
VSEQKEDLQRLYQEISDNHAKWQRLRKFNRNCDGGLTIATIFLTLFIALLGVEGISINDNLRKALIGLSGGVVVAIQSIGNAFPVKQRAGGYQLIQGQAYALKSRLGYLQEDSEIVEKLPQIQEEFYKLLAEADKLES